MLQANTFGKVNVIKNPLSSGEENVAILGLNRIAATLYANVVDHEQSGQKIVGCINIDPIDSNIDMSKFPNLLGDFKDIKEIVKKHAIEKVVLAIDPGDYKKLHDVIQKCEREKINYEVLSNSYDMVYQNTIDNILKGNSVAEEVQVEEEVHEPRELPFQRAVDLAVSLMLFLLFLPSWLVVALAIKLESHGKVLYTQERVGKDGKIFRIYKFRSMYSDAEKRSGPQLATQNDPRITKVGRILRKTRIDELPQLVNVIKGDMSLIGPRPERPYFVEKYRKEIPSYMERLKVKPGLTGFAQVESGYDETLEDVKTKLQHDLYYISNRNSIKLYFKILVKTVWVVLSAKGQ